MLEGLLITAVLAAVVAALFVGARLVMRRPRMRGASAPGSGLLGASLDQVWQPSATQARDILDAEQRVVVEVPVPDDLLPKDTGYNRESSSRM
ncbi:hypothetical protein [Schumannella luteola]